MPSPSEEDNQHKRDSGQGSNPDNHPPQPDPAQQSPCYPPAMGYPSYPNPYPAYPNPPYNHQYAYAQAPPPPSTYYGSAYRTHQNPGNRPAPSGFVRGILTGLTILVIFFCLSTLIMWYVLRPQIPIFTLNRFDVSGFNLSVPLFAAQWTLNLTIENPNKKLRAYFDRIQSYVYYENPNGDNEFLATAFFPPLYVDTEKTAEIGERLTAGEKGQPMVPNWVVEEMKKEKANTGTVSFSLRMVVSSMFKTNEISTRKTELKVFCENLKATFDGDSGNGAVSIPKPLRCLVYL